MTRGSSAARACGDAGSTRNRVDGRRNGGPRRHQPGHPIQQRGGIGRHAGRRRKDSRILGRHAVDDGQAGLDGGAVARIDPAVDGGGEHDAAALLQPDEAVAPGRIVGRQICARDGDQAAAFGETRQRRGDMAQRRVRDPALDMGGGRERRVHQHDGRAHGRIEMIVDMRGVVARDGDVREQPAEQFGAGLGEFVQDQPRAGQLGEDRQQSGPGRGLQHEIGGRDRGGRAGRRSRAPIGVENCWSAWLSSERRVCDGSSAATLASMASSAAASPRGPHRGAELAQEQDLRRLAGLVGGLPIPGAFGVGTAEGRRHGGAQRLGIDGAAAFKIGKQQLRGGDEARKRCSGVAAERAKAARPQWRPKPNKIVHGESPGERERAEPAGRSLDPAGSNPSRPSSHSHGHQRKEARRRRALKSKTHYLRIYRNVPRWRAMRRQRRLVSKSEETRGGNPPRKRRVHSAATARCCGCSGSDAVGSPASSSSPSSRNAGRVSPSVAPMPLVSVLRASEVRSGSGSQPVLASSRSASLAISGFLR